jgi:hypothetical protein
MKLIELIDQLQAAHEDMINTFPILRHRGVDICVGSMRITHPIPEHPQAEGEDEPIAVRTFQEFDSVDIFKDAIDLKVKLIVQSTPENHKTSEDKRS